MFVGRTVYKTRERQEKAELARLEADKQRATKLVFDTFLRHRDVIPGQKFKTTDGTIYGVNEDGSMRRLTGKKSGSKKERREARRIAGRPPKPPKVTP